MENWVFCLCLRLPRTKGNGTVPVYSEELKVVVYQSSVRFIFWLCISRLIHFLGLGFTRVSAGC